MYALPYDLYEERGLRRYGAHGTSVQYLVKRASHMLQKPVEEVNLIVAHLGKIQYLHQNSIPQFWFVGMHVGCTTLLFYMP